MVMRWFLVVVGVFWVIVGTLTVFSTDFIRKKFFSKFKNMDYKKWAYLPVAMGILFLISVPASRARIYISILGILALIKGFYALLGPQDKIKKLINWWMNANNSMYKLWGVVIIILGVLVLINM